MQHNAKDLTGQKFGKLAPVERYPNYLGKNKTYYLCKCDCGGERIVYGTYLANGKVSMCKECVKENNPRRKSYVGQRFGRLVVQEMLYSYKDKHTYAKCKCDCGNTTIAHMGNILKGHTRSCGCFETESRFNRKNHEKDITGERFGRLLVLEKTDDRVVNSSVIWKCKCDCGKIVYANSSNLKRGHTASCGCYKKDYIESTRIDVQPGDKYGYLTILSEIEPNGHRMFKCLCQCGKEVNVSLSDLRFQHTQSCGCMKISKGEQYIESLLKEHNVKYIPQMKFPECKNIRMLPFDFYLPDHNICIEYQGEQHYRAIDFWGGQKVFEYRKNNDAIKKKYCDENNIILLCLPYTKTNDEIKQEIFNFLNPVTTTAA